MRRATSVLLFIFLLSSIGIIDAYEPETHREIARRSASIQPLSSNQMSLDDILKSELGFRAGLETRFPGITVRTLRRVGELIGDGALSEDIPSFRSLNHFHNPLIDPWDNAGLQAFSIFGIPVVRGQSATLWQQNADQDGSPVFMPLPVASGGGNWSWQDARRRFHEALTNPTKDDSPDRKGRDTAFGELFEALGHLSHLIQDASVPAHVRNDPHLIRDGYERHVHRLQQAPAASGRRARFDAWLNRAPVRPPDTIFGPTGHPQAPVPIARLIDTNLFLRGNFDVLGRPDLGIAEYTNGNFLSDDTIFDDFALPRPGSLGRDFFEPEGGGFRRYFEKTSVEGEAIRHFVAESALYEAALAEAGRPMAEALTLTRRTYEDYAEFLLPRAVGYSAALLDYFFRGRLDVDLVIDPDNPSRVKLDGKYETINGSTDSLADGTLELYAEAADGTRKQVPALGSTTITGVAPGAAIPSPTYQPSEEAERFVAVYKGTLGNELRDEANNFPGGVIGKALGGVRVEELFNDGTRWFLRTPIDVYRLPISTSEVQVLKWGDADNMLVGRSDFGAEAPNRFFVYEIARPAGGSEVPTRDEERVEPDGTVVVEKVVDLNLVQQKSFPFEENLSVTTVQLTETLRFQQYLPSLAATRIWTWNESDNGSDYVLTSEEISDAQVSLAVDETRSANRTYPITTLDLAHLVGNFGLVPYYIWRLEDFALSSDGRILAQVRVMLISPGEGATFPIYQLEFPGDVNLPPRVVPAYDITVPFSFPGLDIFIIPGMSISALVDVSEKRVLASTAPPVLTISHETAHVKVGSAGGFSGVREFDRDNMRVFLNDRYVGGGLDGEFFHRGSEDISSTFCPEQMVELGEVSVEIGSSKPSVSQFRPEIAELQFPAMTERTDSVSRLCYGAIGATLPYGFKVTFTEQGSLFIPPDLRRPQPGSTPEELVLLLWGNHKLKLRVVRWTPGANSAELRHEFQDVERQILGVTPEAALLIVDEAEGPLVNFTVVSLIGELSATDFIATDFMVPAAWETKFVLLNPRYLYNRDELKFYSFKPSFQKTALPFRLKDLEGRSRFQTDYHLLRLW